MDPVQDIKSKLSAMTITQQTQLTKEMGVGEDFPSV